MKLERRRFVVAGVLPFTASLVSPVLPATMALPDECYFVPILDQIDLVAHGAAGSVVALLVFVHVFACTISQPVGKHGLMT